MAKGEREEEAHYQFCANSGLSLRLQQQQQQQNTQQHLQLMRDVS